MIKLEERFEKYYRQLEEQVLNEKDVVEYEKDIQDAIKYGNNTPEYMKKLRNDIYNDEDIWYDEEKRSLAKQTYDALNKEPFYDYERDMSDDEYDWDDAVYKFDSSLSQRAETFLKKHKKELMAGDFSSYLQLYRNNNKILYNYLLPLITEALSKYIVDKFNQHNIKVIDVNINKKIKSVPTSIPNYPEHKQFDTHSTYIDFEIERDYAKNSIARDVKHGNRNIIIRDLNGNFFHYTASQKYLLDDLRLLTTFRCRIYPAIYMDYIKQFFDTIKSPSDLFENEVLNIDIHECDIEDQMANIESMSIEEKQQRKSEVAERDESNLTQRKNNAKINNIEQIRSNIDSYDAKFKLNTCLLFDEDTQSFKEYKTTNNIWNDRIKKAESFYRAEGGQLRKRNTSWAVTDGKVIFANATTALRFNGWDIDGKTGNASALYDACQGIYGSNPWQSKKWRFATPNEIKSAQTISAEELEVEDN